MGNSQSGGKRSKACQDALSGFDTNEVAVLTEAFKAAAAQRQPAQTVDISSLQDVLGLQSRGLSERLFRAMEQSAGSSSTKDAMSFDDFAVALSKCCTSARYARRSFWLAIVAGGDGAPVTRDNFRDAITEEVSQGLPPGASYSLRDKVVSETITSAFGEANRGTIDYDDAEKWLMANQSTEGFFSDLLQSKFLRSPGSSSKSSVRMPSLAKPSKMLREEHLWALARQMPHSCTELPWKLLYNSDKHGQSFARMVAKIIFKGPTVIVVRDKGGASFGMFAGASWRKNNRFYGESTSLVFKLEPKCGVYRSSGVNQNYQFLATSLSSSASCANGLGMGGQLDFWGIHLDDRLEKGVCRAPCSTFSDMPLLSSDVNFEVDLVEVWGCHPGYVADEKELEAAGVKKKKAKTWEEYERQQQSKTCLDGDVGAQAILEAAGRTNYSADVRAADALLDKEKTALGGGGRKGEDSSDDEDMLVYDD